MEKDYKQIDIQDEVNKKINSINRTRNNRINASERLYAYTENWDFIFFVMNIEAIVFLVFALTHQENEYGLILSGIFSLYTLILQYYCSNLNYNERALKFHYQQIELEKNILTLKRALKKEENDELEITYKHIMDIYLTNLVGTENHSKLDDNIQTYNQINSSDNPTKGFKAKTIQVIATTDFSTDNVLIFINKVAIIVFPILYVLCRG